MKIGEKFIDGDGSTFHVKETFDPNPALDSARKLRDAGAQAFGESRLVGELPGWLVAQWMKEAGIAHNDSHARNEMLRKKLMDSDNSDFRIWRGSY